jgi:hypothetical protein
MDTQSLTRLAIFKRRSSRAALTVSRAGMLKG